MPSPTTLREVGSPTARRVTVWVNETFGGNVREAARVLGVPYDTLWRLVTARRKKPPLEVLAALEQYTRRPIAEWLGGIPKTKRRARAKRIRQDGQSEAP